MEELIKEQKYYAVYHTEFDKLTKAQVKCLNEKVINIPITKEVYDNIKSYNYIDGEIVYNENYAKEQEELAKKKEQERIANLNMTRGDFIEGLILAQGKDENDIIELIQVLPITDIEKKVYINRVKNALDFYRGYPVIDVLCQYLGLSTEQMTMFFETKDFHYLQVKTDEELPTNEIVEDTTEVIA